MSSSTPASIGTSELQSLLTSNRGWADRIRASDPEFFPNLAKEQKPKVLWFGCSDSRAPESVIMEVLPGVVFTHRNIANQFHLDDDSALSVLSFALGTLHVQHVVVCGHTACGGVKGAVDALPAAHAKSHADGNVKSDANTPLERWLTPLIKLAIDKGIPALPEQEAIARLTVESVEQQVSNIAIASSSVLKAMDPSKRQTITIHGWLYDLSRGEIGDMNISVQVHPSGDNH